MDPKILTENGWKTVVQKFKLKDNGLQKALAIFEKLPDEKAGEKLKAVAVISQSANALKKDKDVAAAPAALKYVTDVAAAAQAQTAELNKAIALAEKNAALAAKKAESAGKKAEEEEEDEKEEGDYHVKLLAAFQKLKGAKGLTFEFIVCDAKPFCAVMAAKKITPKHKEELTKITGGSKRFLHLGTCQFVDGKYDFRMEQPVTGLARKLQDSIKNYVGKKLPIKVGAESAEEDDAPPAAAGAAQSAAAKPPSPALAKAPQLWHGTVKEVEKTLAQLKSAIQKEFASEGPKLIAEVEQHVNKFDQILENLDHSLADALNKAGAATSPAARQAELKAARSIFERCIKFVASDPLVAHIDSNPFGVKTDLKNKVGGVLKTMAPAFA